MFYSSSPIIHGECVRRPAEMPETSDGTEPRTLGGGGGFSYAHTCFPSTEALYDLSLAYPGLPALLLLHLLSISK